MNKEPTLEELIQLRKELKKVFPKLKMTNPRPSNMSIYVTNKTGGGNLPVMTKEQEEFIKHLDYDSESFRTEGRWVNDGFHSLIVYGRKTK